MAAALTAILWRWNAARHIRSPARRWHGRRLAVALAVLNTTGCDLAAATMTSPTSRGAASGATPGHRSAAGRRRIMAACPRRRLRRTRRLYCIPGQGGGPLRVVAMTDGGECTTGRCPHRRRHIWLHALPRSAPGRRDTPQRSMAAAFRISQRAGLP